MPIFDWNCNGKEDGMDKFMDYHLHKETKETNVVKRINKNDNNELDPEKGES